MWDCTQVSEPAHPQFWRNCLTNEKQIVEPKNSSTFQKYCLNKKMRSKNRGVKNDPLATTTTNINYIKNFISILRNKN